MTDLTIVLCQDGSRHLYEQIYEHIRTEIMKGKLLQGEKLPSTRYLAEYLQVSRSTVELAYEQLLAEGYIESRPYRGYFISCPDELFQVSEREEYHGEKDLHHFCPSKDYSSEERKEGGYLVDFSPSAVDMSRFPYATWKKITKQVLSDSSGELFALGNPQGDLELRETIAHYLYVSRRVECAPEQIIIGAGNDYLLLLLEKILGRKRTVAMENPTYRRAFRILQSFGYRICLVGTDSGGMDIHDLRKTDADTAYLMPAHQYPLGVVMPVGRRTEILKWAAEEAERYLIEDDYDSEFRFRGKPIPALSSLDNHGKVIYMGTFSKAIAPAIRVSYMVLPQKLLGKYKSSCSFYSSTVSRIDQNILNEFIRGGHFERYLNRMRKTYREKHDLLLEELEPLLPYFELSGEYAGLHILLRSKGRLSEAEMIERAARAGIRVYGLSDAGVKKLMEEKQEKTNQQAGEEQEEGCNKQTVILGYGALTTEQIVRGVTRLKAAWNS